MEKAGVLWGPVFLRRRGDLSTGGLRSESRKSAAFGCAWSDRLHHLEEGSRV